MRIKKFLFTIQAGVYPATSQAVIVKYMSLYPLHSLPYHFTEPNLIRPSLQNLNFAKGRYGRTPPKIQLELKWAPKLNIRAGITNIETLETFHQRIIKQDDIALQIWYRT